MPIWKEGEKAKPSDSEDLRATVTALAESVKTLTEGFGVVSEAVKNLGQRQATLPMTMDPERRVADVVHKVGDMATRRRVQDLLNPRAATSGFQQDDVVALKEDNGVGSKSSRIRKAITNLPNDAPMLGVIRNYMYTKRNGLRKYKVWVKGLGEDAFTEDELELVS